jgi:hypothetical protein
MLTPPKHLILPQIGHPRVPIVKDHISLGTQKIVSLIFEKSRLTGAFKGN